jgi:hypothetical protein
MSYKYLLAGIERDKTSATSPEHTVRIRSLMIDVFPHPFSPTSITGLPYSVKCFVIFSNYATTVSETGDMPF